jgi:hypothetical protein
MTMKNIAKVFGLLAGAASLTFLLPAAQAAAQQAGAYVGHTADGNLISFDVGVDAQGQPVLTDLAIKFTAACAQSGSSVTQSWQFFFGTGLPIVHGHVKQIENTPQLYLLDSISFHNGRATGATEARLPVLTDAKSQSVQLCSSAKQAFEANFQTVDSAHLFDHPGNARLKAPQRTSVLEWSSQGMTYQQLTRQQ